jgi:glycine C-acetyltransferase
MNESIKYQGGENFDLRQILLRGRNSNLQERTGFFQGFIDDLRANSKYSHSRKVLTPADREVLVEDSKGKIRPMLMFGSNNYLGFANNPIIIEKTIALIKKYGIGLGGPPLLNGYTLLHEELESRLAALKKCEHAMIFSSGYSANVGLLSGLLTANDNVIYDEYSHASFCDGLKLSGTKSLRFTHNDSESLERKLDVVNSNRVMNKSDVYVGVEGVYSMDGDLAPLDKIVTLCKQKNAILILDDAHGTGVTGSNGFGTSEQFSVEGDVDIVMGTFSKAFAMSGGFVASTKSIIEYLRFFSRSYMFSASLPPVVIAAVLAGLDVLESQDSPLPLLKENIKYADYKFNEIGFNLNVNSAIIPLIVPEGIDIRVAAGKFEERDIFINSIEYPAVPINLQRFRISLMATHTKDDIDKLVSSVDEIWTGFGIESHKICNVA